MKSRIPPYPTFGPALATAGLMSAFLAVQAQAATFTWSEAVNNTPAANGNWSSGVSWSGGVPPVSAADTTLSFGMTFGSNSTAETNTLTNNVANPFQLNVLTLTGTSSAANGSNIATVNIAGSPLNFVANGPTAPVVNLNASRTAGQGVVYNIQNNIALSSNITFTGDFSTLSGRTPAIHNFSGVISGSGFGLTKSGTNSLTLSGANTYTGNTTLSGGTLILANNSALSAGDLNVTGNSSIGFTNGVNISNAINRGTSTVTYFMAGTTAATATYSGVLTGSGTINIGNSGSGNNQTNLDFTNTGNTFTGNVVGATGNANGADYFRFASIGDGGNFTFNKSGNRGGVIYNGASSIEFDTRQIALGTSFGGGGVYGLNGNGIVQNAFQNNAASSDHTVTFNTALSVGAIASSSVFYFDGTNIGNNTFAGDIGDATGANTLGIGKQGTGKWILSGSNSFEGNAFILNGTLSVNTMDVAANNQALGKGSLIYFSNGSSTTSTLEFTGSTNSSTDKQIVLGSNNNNHNGGGTILNNGDGTLSFTNPTFNSLPGGVSTVDRTLTLGGTNIGANTISGTIQDNVSGAAQTILNKTGSGKWVLSGNNTYTGTTSISGGTLQFAKQNSLYNNNTASWTKANIIVNNGGTLAFNVGGTGEFNNSDVTTLLGNLTVAINNNGLRAGSNIGFDTSNATGGTFTVGNVIANSTGTGSGAIGLTKLGTGTLVLTNANTYTGATNVNDGTLIVNGSISTSVLTTVQNGATLAGSGTVGALTIDAGGTFAPGNSPGITIVNGDYIQNGTLEIEIDGLTPGTQHDQVQVTGAVTLNGLLDLTFSTFTPADGDLILILLNDGVDQVNGTFTGLAEGAVAGSYSGFDWQISYMAGDGNDISLFAAATAVIPEPSTALLVAFGSLFLIRRKR